MSRRALTVLVLAALAAGGCGGAGKHKQAKTGGKPAAPGKAQSGQTSCRNVKAPPGRGPQHLKAPKLTLDPAKTWTATLDVRHAPKTTASFVYLARRGFYDHLVFHRVVPGFVIQGGDPLGNGQGGPGYSVVEAPSKSLQYTRGVVAMAKTQVEAPGTSGSQFYVVTGPDAQLPPDYALLGRVTTGLDTVERIGAVPTNPQTQAPLNPVVIDHVTITANKGG